MLIFFTDILFANNLNLELQIRYIIYLNNILKKTNIIY